MKKKVTIRDVAAAAGVSHQTISRVINDRPDVAEETRQRVWQVIEKLGYQPSAIARSLVSQRSYTLGLITADFTDYFFTQVIVGAEIEARKHDYFFMLCSTEQNPDDEPEYLRLLTERQVFSLPGLALSRIAITSSRCCAKACPWSPQFTRYPAKN